MRPAGPPSCCGTCGSSSSSTLHGSLLSTWAHTSSGLHGGDPSGTAGCLGFGGVGARQLSRKSRAADAGIIDGAATGLASRLRLVSGSSTRRRTLCAAAGDGRRNGKSGTIPASATAPINAPFTLNQLATLRALAVTQGVEEAMELLSCGEANLRATLKALEKAVGQELVIKPLRLTRASKPLMLTPAGTLLLRYAERVLAVVADMQAALADLKNSEAGVLCVGASQTTGVYIMPRLIEVYKRRRANVTVNLRVENTKRCCYAVASGAVEVALVGGDIPKELEHVLQVCPYMEDEVVMVAAPSHPLSQRGGPIDRTELQALQFVSLHRSSTMQRIADSLQANGIDWRKLTAVMEVNSVEAIKAAVAVNLGVAFVSRQAVQAELGSGALRELPIRGVRLGRQVLLVADASRYRSRAVRAFVREMFKLQGVAAPEHLLSPSQQAATARLQERVARLPADSGRSPSPSLRDASPLPGWDSLHSASASADCAAPPPPLDPPSASRSWPANPSSRRTLSPSASSSASRRAPARRPAASPGWSGAPGEKLPFTLAQLAAFDTVAASGSTKAASLVLSVSQPNVSKLVSSLEQALALPLVQAGRLGGAKLQLSEHGQLVASYTTVLMQLVREAVQALDDHGCAKTGVVALGASQTTGTYLLPRLIGFFRQRNPDVRVQLQVDNSRSVCDAVAGGALDIAIIGGEVPHELRDSLTVTQYSTDELVLICGRQHPLAAGPPVEAAALYDLSYVSLNEGSSVQAVQEGLLRENGLDWQRFKVEMEFNSVEAIKSAVQFGLGVAFVSSSAIEKELELGLVARVDIQGIRLMRRLHLVSKTGRQFQPAAAKFLQDVFQFTPCADGCMLAPTSATPTGFSRLRPWEHGLLPERVPGQSQPPLRGNGRPPSGPISGHCGGLQQLNGGMNGNSVEGKVVLQHPDASAKGSSSHSDGAGAAGR